MGDGMQVTWRGLRGPATLSKPEAMGSSEVSAQTSYEESPGRKVPSPSEQTKQEAIRTDKLRSQAKNRGLRDKAVRSGGLKKIRPKDPKYKILSSRSVPQWGESNVCLTGDSSNALPKTAAAAMRVARPRPIRVMKPKAPKIATPKVVPKVAPKPMPGPAVKPGVPPKTPLSEGRMRDILKQHQAVQTGDTLSLAKTQGMKVGPWAKMVSNPYGSMLMQMAAMTAIEPVMYGLGINSPILGGILPFMAMQSLPGLLESSAGIPRIKSTLGRLAERGKLKLPVAAKPQVPQVPPAPGMMKASSVAIPGITTVFG